MNSQKSQTAAIPPDLPLTKKKLMKRIRRLNIFKLMSRQEQ